VLVIKDPHPLKATDAWRAFAQLATIGMFLLAFVTALYFGRPFLMPILAALLVGATFAPLIKMADQRGVSPWLTAVVIVMLVVAAIAVAASLFAAPVIEWIGRAPEIGAIIKEKFYVFDRPLAALRDLQKALMPPSRPEVAVETSQIALVTPVVAFVTPAVAQVVLFFATLLFVLAGQIELRRYAASWFRDREAKLRFIRIANDIEDNLASYVAVLTVINLGLGTLVAVGAWLFGLPNPVVFGVMIAVLNYLPYIGPAIMVIVLFGVGLVTFPTLGYALLPPAAFVALATLEGQIFTPMILGHRLTLNPLAVFLSIAFWAWLWGPMGAFLAVPLLIVGMVVINHVFPAEDSKLPG
jgi:predicted PurR-regulated permease PerM